MKDELGVRLGFAIKDSIDFFVIEVLGTVFFSFNDQGFRHFDKISL